MSNQYKSYGQSCNNASITLDNPNCPNALLLKAVLASSLIPVCVEFQIVPTPSSSAFQLSFAPAFFHSSNLSLSAENLVDVHVPSATLSTFSFKKSYNNFSEAPSCSLADTPYNDIALFP